MRLSDIGGELHINGHRTAIYTHGWVLPVMLDIAGPLLVEAKKHFGCYSLGRAKDWWVGSMWNIHQGGAPLGLPDLKREAKSRRVDRAIAKVYKRASQ